MKNRKNFLTIALCVALVIVFAVLLKDPDQGTKNPDGKYTITITSNVSSLGNLSIATKDGEEYIDQKSTSVTVDEGTKTKIYFTDDVNPDYEIVCWSAAVDGVMKYVYTNSEGGEFYNDSKFIKTVTQDIDVYVYAVKKGTDYHTVTFYDSSVTGKRNMVGAALVADGKDANENCVISQAKKGFDQIGWSKDITNVTEDLDVYPIFNSNIYTMFRDYHSQFMHGLLVTLILSVIAVSCAMVLGVIICLIRLSGNKFFGAIVTAYVEVIRGVPLLLQLLIVYVLLGPTKVRFGTFFTTEVLSCILTLTINSSAYSSEVFRSGIQAVEGGQMEAGRALGLSKWQVMKNIVIPQGIRNALPSIVNELVQMIKETSLAVSVDASIGELMSVRKNITAATYVNLPPYIIVAIIYFCVTFSLSKCVGILERRLAERG